MVDDGVENRYSLNSHGMGVFSGVMHVYVAELFANSGGLSPTRKRIRWGNPDDGRKSFCSVSCDFRNAPVL